MRDWEDVKQSKEREKREIEERKEKKGERRKRKENLSIYKTRSRQEYGTRVVCVSASSTPSCDHYRRGATSRWGVRPKSGMDFFYFIFSLFPRFCLFLSFYSSYLILSSGSLLLPLPQGVCVCVSICVCVCACVTHDGDEPIKGPSATKGMFIDGSQVPSCTDVSCSLSVVMYTHGAFVFLPHLCF